MLGPQQVASARQLVETLCAAPNVDRVHYPGLESHPQHGLASRQMSGPGAIISFEFHGDQEKLLERVRVFACAVSLGGVQSLIEVPALMTHRPIPRATRRASA